MLKFQKRKAINPVGALIPGCWYRADNDFPSKIDIQGIKAMYCPSELQTDASYSSLTSKIWINLQKLNSWKTETLKKFYLANQKSVGFATNLSSCCYYTISYYYLSDFIKRRALLGIKDALKIW